MLVVHVELISAITGVSSEIGTLVIANDGTGTVISGNYSAVALRKRKSEYTRREMVKALQEGMANSSVLWVSTFKGYKRKSASVWRLVGGILEELGYTSKE